MNLSIVLKDQPVSPGLRKCHGKFRFFRCPERSVFRYLCTKVCSIGLTGVGAPPVTFRDMSIILPWEAVEDICDGGPTFYTLRGRG